MRQSKEAILPFVDDRKSGAKYFGVSERTFIRWMDFYGLYEPRENYGNYKLSPEDIDEIRRLHAEGVAMKELAKRYCVTISSISRVIHKVTHKVQKEMAIVSVIYNVRSSE
jgi:hypothetical protein